MASPVVQRYAQISSLPVEQVEQLWRQCKRTATDEGKKNDYTRVVAMLREALSLGETDGRIVYFDGVAESEILAETPAYALIQVKELESLDPSIRAGLERSKGITVANYEHLKVSRDSSESLSYPYERVEEMTSSASIGSAPVQTTSVSTGSVTSTRPATRPATSSKPKGDSPELATYKSKRAVVVKRGDKRTKIKYVDTGKEEEVDSDKLAYDENMKESVQALWESLNPYLSSAQKLTVFGEILKLENDLMHMPPSLVEQIAREVDKDEADTFNVNDEDWNIIFQKELEDPNEKKEEEEHAPLPSRPQVIDKSPDAPEEDPEDDTTGGPPGKARPASEHEVNSVLKAMRQEALKSTGKGINIQSLREKASKEEARLNESKSGKKSNFEPAKSTEQKNEEIGKRWNRFL